MGQTAALIVVFALLTFTYSGNLFAQDLISQLEVTTETYWQNSPPTLKSVKAAKSWKKATPKGLLSTNDPFLIRIPIDSVLRGEQERILSIRSEATLFVYEPDGQLIPVREILNNHPRVNDKLSIKVSEADNIDGYVLAWVQPRIGLVPSAVPNTSTSLILLSSTVNEYDLLESNFDVKSLRAYEYIKLILLGGIFMLACYFGLLFISNREESIFGIYSAYLFFHSIYWFERTITLSLPFFTRSVDQMVVNTISQICFHVAFALLAYQLLNFEKYYPKLAKTWRIFVVVQLVFAVLFTLFMYAGVNAVLLLDAFAIERCIIATIALITITYFVLKPHNIYCYFLGFASFLFVGSALASMFLEDLRFFALGLSIEILTFAYAIGHKIKKADESRIESEKSAFKLEREVIRTKDAALRAQMNPHFISNVINALRALILEGENQQAYNYLSRFAHVVRTMLGSSDKQVIPLRQELRLLKDYIALEELRFDRAVKFEFNLDKALELEGTLIPPMLLQPLVENAMHHGLFPLTERDPLISLTIRASPSAKSLLIVVSDNGIGVKKATETQKKRKRKRPSMGLKLIRERIKLIQEGSNFQPSRLSQDVLVINELVDENGICMGTKITLILPNTKLEDLKSADKDFEQGTLDYFFKEEKLRLAATLPHEVVQPDQKPSQ